ncbi:MAG TPA: 16S rRNA (uracil(1498)-N(3))-methyltransferase [Kiloniellales bacterium]|jgi:16S rRNA (uracil1498-N3)-methyltransferase|nr:16S rRNA (uracil(1498)-N(3))-methyltransferase [Kiloniellales bacterium]
MSRLKPATRLYLEADLVRDGTVELDRAQAHFLKTVLRLESGASLLVFNGRDGEWEASVSFLDKKAGGLSLERQRRPQEASSDLWLAFAPIKAGRIDWLVEKATELGVSRLLPVITRRTVVERVKLERLQANAREAAEQSERLDIPDVLEPQSLDRLLQSWPAERRLLVAAERQRAQPLPEALASELGAYGLLIGPEGGFAPEELERAARFPFVSFVSLGPRILRAETAALAALAVTQAVTGAWS